ncbi:MAG: M20 family metallopeptidase [Acidiferrobacterales bacterium]
MSGTASAIELTRELIRVNTVNPPGNERACAEYLGRMLEGAGFSVSYHEFADSRTSLVARIGGATDKPPLCFTGHLDTVPLGAMPWSVDPFAADTDGGRLYGRGSTDMKSGVAAFVTAVLQLASKLGRSPGVVLVITAAEETGSEGAYHLAGLADVLGRAGAIVVAEPTANYPFVGHKGALWLKALTQGVTAHGAMPERGVNAIYKAAHAITKLERFNFNVSAHQVLGPPTINIGTVHGGMNINSVPDRTEISIDIRTVPSQDHNAVRKRLEDYLGAEVEISPIVDVGSVWTDPTDAWVQEVFDIMASVLDEAMETRSASYFTDAAALKPAYGGPPTVILGPGEPALAHQTDEYCVVHRIEQAVEANMLITKRWCEL